MGTLRKSGIRATAKGDDIVMIRLFPHMAFRTALQHGAYFADGDNLPSQGSRSLCELDALVGLAPGSIVATRRVSGVCNTRSAIGTEIAMWTR